MRNAIFCLITFAGLAAAQSVGTLSITSAAEVIGTVSPNSLATAWGSGFTTQSPPAPSLPLPTVLGGVSVQVTDNSGVATLAPLVFVSAGQINFLVPAQTALGTATFRVLQGSTVVAQGTAPVQAVAPAVFTIVRSRVAAALAVQTIAPNGPQTVFPVFSCSGLVPTPCVPVPLYLGVDTPLAIELFATGVSGASGQPTVTATIAGQPVPVLYAGPQNQYPGLDQVNISVPLTLRSIGIVNIILTVNGVAADPVQVLIQ